MRDILLLTIVFAGCILALRRPWIGVMLWTWISIMNPHRYAWGIAYDAPLAAIVAGVTLVGLLVTKNRQSPFQGAPVWWLLIFSTWMTLSWLMAYDFTGDYDLWSRAAKIYLMSFVALALLYSKHHIMAFVWVTVGSIALLAAKGGLFTIITGGSHRVWGPAASFIADNNHFALAVLTTVPLLHFLQLQLGKAWHRHAMSVIMLLCMAAALGSQSRGAFLALIAMGSMFWWRSERKWLMTAMLLIVLLALLPMMPETWWSRMDTIRAYEEDTSAMGRINAWIVALEVAKHHFFGGGMSYQHAYFFNIYGVYETTVRAAHSIYFQILGNHGFVGLLLYLALWFSTYRTAGWLRKNASNIPEAKWTADLGNMVQVGLIGCAVGGAFLSMPYFDLPYNMMIMVVLARAWVHKGSWEREAQQTFLQSIGFKKTKPIQHST